MIAFGPDTDVPATPLQRVAHRALIVACTILGLGVISSVARLSANPAPIEGFAHRGRLVVDQNQMSMMASDRTTAAKPPSASTELVRDTPAEHRSATGTRIAWMMVTAYCPCTKCCGKHAVGLTASGRATTENYGHFVAAPAELPFGAKVTVPGYNSNRAVPVYDRGGAIKGNRLDVFFPTHDQAKAWGRRWVAVTITGE